MSMAGKQITLGVDHVTYYLCVCVGGGGVDFKEKHLRLNHTYTIKKHTHDHYRKNSRTFSEPKKLVTRRKKYVHVPRKTFLDYEGDKRNCARPCHRALQLSNEQIDVNVLCVCPPIIEDNLFYHIFIVYCETTSRRTDA